MTENNIVLIPHGTPVISPSLIEEFDRNYPPGALSQQNSASSISDTTPLHFFDEPPSSFLEPLATGSIGECSYQTREEHHQVSSNPPIPTRFHLSDKQEIEQLSIKQVPLKTQASTKWALAAFMAWSESRNNVTGIEKCPTDLLERQNPVSLNYWLKIFGYRSKES